MPGAHLFAQFLLVVIGGISLVWLVATYYRQSKSIANTLPSASRILIESSQPIEPRKNLHIVRVGDQRFLVASTDQQTQLISALSPLTPQEIAALDVAQQSVVIGPSATWLERLFESFRMVARQYFGQR